MHPNFKARDYQIDDLARLISDPRTLLGHDPGGGKTYIAGMFTEYICNATNEAVVWTQPGGIMQKNLDDILYCTNLAPEEVAIVQGTKEKRVKTMQRPEVKVFLMSGVGYCKEWELLPPRVRHTVHDECHLYITTHGIPRVEAWYRAQKNKRAIVPMTGTIIRGRLSSAYPVCHVLAPWAYGSDRQFAALHAWYDESGAIIGWKNHERLKAVLQTFGIFRSFKSIYGAEKKVIQIERCYMTPKQEKMYRELEVSGLIELEDEFVDAGNPAVNAMRARQILACPELFEIKEPSGKDEATRVEIEDHLKSGERLAIFSAFSQEQLRIVKMIQTLGGTVGHINGTVSYETRQKIDKDFRENQLQFVVASPATAGIGFNWGFLKTMLYLSVDYMDDSFIQSYRRGIRGEREEPLRIKLLKYEDTIEHRIFEIIDRKSMDHHLVNEGIDTLNLSQL